MSVVCTVAAATTVTLSAAALTSLASATAGIMAMRQLNAAEGEVHREELRQRQQAEVEAEAEARATVELGSAQAKILGSLVAERCHLVFADDRVTLNLSRDIRGTLKIIAHGHGLSEEEVSERAARFLGLLQQQIAYREVVTRMKRYGLAVQQEQRLEDGTVKVRIGGGRR